MVNKNHPWKTSLNKVLVNKHKKIKVYDEGFFQYIENLEQKREQENQSDLNSLFRHKR